MAKYMFEKVLTAEAIKQMIEKDLGSTYQLKVIRNRIQIVQDAARGCALLVKEKDGKTICQGPHSFMPSVGLRIAIVLPFVVGFVVLGVMTGRTILAGLGPVLAFALGKALLRSGDLVGRVSGLMERLSSIKNDHATLDIAQKPTPESDVLSCPHCGSPYRATDYQASTENWFCSSCKNSLPRKLQ